jgi:hypothetical protein
VRHAPDLPRRCDRTENESALAGRSYYMKAALHDAARASFKSAYVKVASGAAFDEWRCRTREQT